MRSGLDVIDESIGTGPIVQRSRTYRLRLRMWLNRGEPIRWSTPWGKTDGAMLEDDGATLVSDIRLHRENLINGVFYGMDGMRIGGSRTLRISPHLAYGSTGVPSVIPENAVLTVEVTVLDEANSRTIDD